MYALRLASPRGKMVWWCPVSSFHYFASDLASANHCAHL